MNTDLAFGKEPDRFLALGMKHAVERALHAAEGIECHGRHDSDIDSEIAAFNLILKLAGMLAVGGEDGVTVMKRVLVADFDGLKWDGIA